MLIRWKIWAEISLSVFKQFTLCLLMCSFHGLLLWAWMSFVVIFTLDSHVKSSFLSASSPHPLENVIKSMRCPRTHCFRLSLINLPKDNSSQLVILFYLADVIHPQLITLCYAILCVSHIRLTKFNMAWHTAKHDDDNQITVSDSPTAVGDGTMAASWVVNMKLLLKQSLRQVCLLLQTMHPICLLSIQMLTTSATVKPINVTLTSTKID